MEWAARHPLLVKEKKEISFGINYDKNSGQVLALLVLLV